MATKTINKTGGDFATIALWATTYINSLALSAAEVGEVWLDTVSELTAVAATTIGGYTGNSGVNTVTLKPAAGLSFRDNANKLTNTLRYNSANGVGYRNTVSFGQCLITTGGNFILDGMQLYNDASSYCQGAYRDVSQITNIVRNCILQASPDNNSLSHSVVNITSVTMENCLVLINGGAAGNGIYSNGTGATPSTLTAITVAASGAGSSGAGITQGYTPASIVKNCVVSGFTTDYSGTADATCTNNATDLGAFGGTNWGATAGQVSIVKATEWTNVTGGTEDYSLKATSVKLKNNGATVGSANDIIGTIRPQGASYDIGCWELVAAASDVLFAQAIM